MRISEPQRLCLSLPGAEARRPFADKPELVAVTVGGKWFALFDDEAPEPDASVNLKTDPDEAQALREAHRGIVPGWHMNKRHWNTVALESDVPDELIAALVEISHGLVLNSLTRRARLLIAAEGDREVSGDPTVDD